MGVLTDADISFTDLIGYSKLQELLQKIVAALREQEQAIQPLQGAVDELRHNGHSVREQVQAVVERLDIQQCQIGLPRLRSRRLECCQGAIQPSETATGGTGAPSTTMLPSEQFQELNTRMDQYEELLKQLQAQSDELRSSRAEFEQQLKEEQERQVNVVMSSIQEESSKMAQHTSALGNGVNHVESTSPVHHDGTEKSEEIGIAGRHPPRDCTQMLEIKQDVFDLSRKLNEVITLLGGLGLENLGYHLLSTGEYQGLDPQHSQQQDKLAKTDCSVLSAGTSPSREASLELDERAGLVLDERTESFDERANSLVNSPRAFESSQGKHRRWVTYVTLLAAQNNIIAKHEGEVIEIYACSQELTLGRIRSEMKQRFPENILQMTNTGGIALDSKFDAAALSTDEAFAKIRLCTDEAPAYMIC